METFIAILHVFVSIFLVLVVLLQPGKGGGAGAAFGAAGQAVFGPRGSTSLLAKLTTISAVIFMLSSMTLAWYSGESKSIMGDVKGDVKTETALQPAEDESAMGDPALNTPEENMATTTDETTAPPATADTKAPSTESKTTPADKSVKKLAPTKTEVKKPIEPRAAPRVVPAASETKAPVKKPVLEATPKLKTPKLKTPVLKKTGLKPTGETKVVPAAKTDESAKEETKSE